MQAPSAYDPGTGNADRYGAEVVYALDEAIQELPKL